MLKNVALAAVLVSLGGMAGLALERQAQLLERVLRKFDPESAAIAADAASNSSDFHNRTLRLVECPPQRRTMVALVVGQSNTANFAESRTKAGPRVSVFYQGRCYEAADPLPGATGVRGSPWPHFAEKVLQAGLYERVLLVPASVGSTTMASWAPGGVNHDRIEVRRSKLAERGLRITHSLVGQGEWEASAKADPVAYLQSATSLLSSLPGTVFFATTGLCESTPNAAIRAAQEAARRSSGALPGPDMDLITDRINGCHLGAKGQRAAAEAWAAAIAR